MASLTEKVTQTAPGGTSAFQVNTLYSKLNVQLADHERAVTVAKAYQYYRITSVLFTFKPRTNVQAYGSGGTTPYFYSMIDKSGAIPTNITLESMKRMGAKARKFTRPITVKYKPSVLSPAQVDQTGASASAKPTISPWLSTNKNITQPGVFNPSVVDHLGLFWYVNEQAGAQEYDMDMTVNFEFKGPIWATEVSTTYAQSAENAKTDTSSDGIVNHIE